MRRDLNAQTNNSLAAELFARLPKFTQQEGSFSASGRQLRNVGPQNYWLFVVVQSRPAL